MGEGSQRVSILEAEPTPKGKHVKAGSKLFSFNEGQIRPAAETYNQVPPALPLRPHQPQDKPGPSTGNTDSFLEASAKNIFWVLCVRHTRRQDKNQSVLVHDSV